MAAKNFTNCRDRPEEQFTDTFQMAGGTARQQCTLNSHLVCHLFSWFALPQAAANYKIIPSSDFIVAIQKAAGSNRTHTQFSFCCYLG